MRIKLFFLIQILLVVSSTVYAYVPTEGQVTFGYSLNIYKTQFAGSPTLKDAPMMLGLGLVATGDLNSSNSIEVGISHLNKVFYREQSGRYLAEQTSLVQVNLGYRKWFLEMANIGLSLTSGYPFGNYSVVHSDAGLDLESSTTAREISHYAGELSLQFEIYKDQKDYWMLDLYWSQSFSAKSNEQANHAGLVITYKTLVRDNNSTTQSPPEPEQNDDSFVQ